MSLWTWDLALVTLSLFWSLPVLFHWVSTDSPASLNRFFFHSGFTTSLNSSQQFSVSWHHAQVHLMPTPLPLAAICLTAPLSTRIRKSHRSDERCKLSPRQIKILRETPSQPCIFYSGFRVALMNGNIHKGLEGSHQIPFFVSRLYHSSILSMELFCVMMLKCFFLDFTCCLIIYSIRAYIQSVCHFSFICKF